LGTHLLLLDFLLGCLSSGGLSSGLGGSGGLGLLDGLNSRGLLYLGGLLGGDGGGLGGGSLLLGGLLDSGSGGNLKMGISTKEDVRQGTYRGLLLLLLLFGALGGLDLLLGLALLALERGEELGEQAGALGALLLLGGLGLAVKIKRMVVGGKKKTAYGGSLCVLGLLLGCLGGGLGSGCLGLGRGSSDFRGGLGGDRSGGLLRGKMRRRGRQRTRERTSTLGSTTAGSCEGLSGKNKETKGKTYRSRGGGLLDLGGLDNGLGDSDGGDLGLDLLDGGGCSSDFRGRHYGS
jgi:hypothetical protein